MFSPNFGAGKTNFAYETPGLGSTGRLFGHCTGSRFAQRRKLYNRKQRRCANQHIRHPQRA